MNFMVFCFENIITACYLKELLNNQEGCRIVCFLYDYKIEIYCDMRKVSTIKVKLFQLLQLKKEMFETEMCETN